MQNSVQIFPDSGCKPRPTVSTPVHAIIQHYVQESGVLFMDTIAEIRRRHWISKETCSSIARDLKLSHPAVRKHCRTRTEPIHRRRKQSVPMPGALQERLETDA